jgi:hypothetical protein
VSQALRAIFGRVKVRAPYDFNELIQDDRVSVFVPHAYDTTGQHVQVFSPGAKVTVCIRFNHVSITRPVHSDFTMSLISPITTTEVGERHIVDVAVLDAPSWWDWWTRNAFYDRPWIRIESEDQDQQRTECHHHFRPPNRVRLNRRNVMADCGCVGSGACYCAYKNSRDCGTGTVLFGDGHSISKATVCASRVLPRFARPRFHSHPHQPHID